MPDITHARQIVFIRTDRLGETLLNLPVLSALKAALPKASLTFVVHPELEPLVRGAAPVDRVMTYAPGSRWAWWVRSLRLAIRLRRHHFDLAVVSNPMKELHLAVWMAGIPWRVGYRRKWGRWLLTCRVEDHKALGERHEVEYNFDLIRALGLPTGSPGWCALQFEPERHEVRQLLLRQGIRPSDPFIVVHPWSSNPVKEWPSDRFRSLMEQASARLGLRVVVIGGASEAVRATHQSLERGCVADFTGRLNLRQLGALLQGARLLVSNDSGPVHLAAAVGTKTIVLFGGPSGASGPARWGPWGEGHTVLWKPSLEAITVDEVLQAIERHVR